MSRTKTKQITGGVGRWINEVGVLVKWRLTMTVVFSSVMSFAIAAGSSITFSSALILALGGFLVAGAANAINEILERDYDKLMERTMDRPVASNRMAISEAVIIAGLMLFVGVLLLAYFNSLTAFIGILSFILYAFIYTPIVKIYFFFASICLLPICLLFLCDKLKPANNIFR